MLDSETATTYVVTNCTDNYDSDMTVEGRQKTGASCSGR